MTYFYNIDGQTESNFDTFSSEIVPLMATLICNRYSTSLILVLIKKISIILMNIIASIVIKFLTNLKELVLPSMSMIHLILHFTPRPQQTFLILKAYLFRSQREKKLSMLELMYRPSNTKFADFLVEAKKLIKILPKGRTYLMGTVTLILIC